jgi:MYXO-CTERM domain-containing protein
VAPTIDCFNMTRGETSFSLDIGGASVVAKIVGQEAAHVWGLEHVDSANDLLFPTTGGAGDPSFEDACHQIVVLDGGIQPTEAACAEMHEINCPGQPDQQNSYQDMMMVFGPRTPDMTAPTLEIIAPTEGEAFASGADVEVRFTMLDDVSPPLFEVYASLDVDAKGDPVGSADLFGPQLSLPVTGLPDGEHLIRIDIEDQSGNTASDLVHFVISDAALPEEESGEGSSEGSTGTTGAGSGASTGEDITPTGGDDAPSTGTPIADDGGPSGCGCRTTGSGLAPLLLLLLGVSRRRR